MVRAIGPPRFMTRLHPIIVVTIVGAIAAFCIMRVQFSASLYEMLTADLPEVQGMDRLNRYFSRDGQLIVTVKAEESFLAEEAILSLSETLESQPELVGEVFRELSLTDRRRRTSRMALAERFSRGPCRN